MHPIQAFVNQLSAGWQRERSTTQMNLGKLIDRLEQLPQGLEMEAITSAYSYRGYYCDLAFEPADGKMMVKDVLTLAKAALGEVFTGYKGGDYMMDADTPVWLSNYGECGKKIMGIADDGTLELRDDE